MKLSEEFRLMGQSRQAVEAAPLIIDYLVAHELAHLFSPHHDSDFWQRLERAMPDYAVRKQWLAEQGGRF